MKTSKRNQVPGRKILKEDKPYKRPTEPSGCQLQSINNPQKKVSQYEPTSDGRQLKPSLICSTNDAQHLVSGVVSSAEPELTVRDNVEMVNFLL
ncbi:hypothetical protein Trydic_g633 [Trypoxylus dichotomus]